LTETKGVAPALRLENKDQGSKDISIDQLLFDADSSDLNSDLNFFK